MANGSSERAGQVGSMTIALALLATPAAGAEPNFYLQPDTATVEPGTHIPEGSVLVIHCPWSVTKMDLNFGSMHLPEGSGEGRVSLKRNDGSEQTIKTFTKLIAPGFYTKDAPPKGDMKTDWVAKGVGPALVICRFGGHKYAEPVFAKVPIVVTSNVKAKSQAAHPATKSPFGVTLPPPKIGILGVTWKTAQGCNPSDVLTATVKIQNTGKALPAGRGVVGVLQYGPDQSAGLVGTDVLLPALSSGESLAIDVSVAATKKTPAQLVSLGGEKFSFHARVKPIPASSFTAPDWHDFYAVFPKSFCRLHPGAPTAPMAKPESPQGTTRDTTPAKKSPAR